MSHHRERIDLLAHELRITAFLDRPSGKPTSGQKTRVALAKALLNEPELLLLDEPTTSLDPDAGDWLRSYLEDYRSAPARRCCSPLTMWVRSSGCARTS